MRPTPGDPARAADLTAGPTAGLTAVVAELRAAGCVFAEDEAALLLAAAKPGVADRRLEQLVARRVAGAPLEQVLGWVDFCGLRVRVAPGVFVPRQRTALLVRVAVARARAGAVVVDLGCGTGALLQAVRAQVPGVQGWAVDVDPAAVDCARLGLPADRVLLGDLYDALPGRLRGRVEVVLANAPYVPSEEVEHLPREAREHEHRIALDGGVDGLDVQRRVLGTARQWLAPGGWVLVETGEPQLAASRALVAAAGLTPRVWREARTGGLVVGGRADGR